MPENGTVQPFTDPPGRARLDMKFIPLVLLSVCVIVCRAEAQGETWRVVWWSSGYLYARCFLEIGQFQSAATARLDCVPNGAGGRVSGERMLSASEASTISALVKSSDFYGGSGLTGFGPPFEDADFATLRVKCCGRQDWISVVVSGNRTFEQPGSRRELAEVFGRLRKELGKGL